MYICKAVLFRSSMGMTHEAEEKETAAEAKRKSKMARDMDHLSGTRKRLKLISIRSIHMANRRRQRTSTTNVPRQSMFTYVL